MVEAFGISLKTFIAGLFGSLISLRFFEGMSWPGRAITVMGGAFIAGFSAPWALEFFEMAQKHEGFIGFVIGLFGMSICSAIFKGISQANLWELIKERLPGGKR